MNGARDDRLYLGSANAEPNFNIKFDYDRDRGLEDPLVVDEFNVKMGTVTKGLIA